MTQKIMIYTIPGCSFCSRARTILKQRKIQFEETVLEPGSKESEDLYKKTNVKTFPQIFINGKFIGGLSELEDMLFI